MREILFRGKRVDSDEWVEGDLLQPTKAGFLRIYEISDNNSLMGDRYEIVPETVGQYTGLTDKNGKKIFEGDIINGNYFANDTELNGFTVRYTETLACFDILKGNCGNYLFHIINIEVIGNKHDNPELLEGRE